MCMVCLFSMAPFESTNTMALHTGLGMLVLGCGIVVEPVNSTIVRLLASRERGGWLVRRFLPILADIPGASGLSLPASGGELWRASVWNGAVCADAGAWRDGIAAGGWGSSSIGRRSEQAGLAEVALVASAAIEVSERELRLVTDHLPLLLSYFDLEGRYLRVNRTYEEWLGMPAEKIVGRTIREMLGEEYWQRTRATREEAEAWWDGSCGDNVSDGAWRSAGFGDVCSGSG